MEIIDYIFIICSTIVVFTLLVLIISALIPKSLMFKSKNKSIQRGKIIGSLIGTITGIFICYYIVVKGYVDLLFNSLFGLF
tara:strand:+ start:954 stop:1196 length:243 start_codon:yes stop_codon:yes gene_type:complete